MHELLSKETGKKLLLLGNEAIVRGALEAGVVISAAYPGTPSSEIGNNLFQITQDSSAQVYFEFSTNEKVATEIAAAASAAGVRSLTAMKHVGMNVASDVIMTLAYMGTKAGMVIICADDPSLHSSQNEQDNRYYAQMAGLPMLEPSSPQEAKDMTMAAFEISEALELPVIIRTTTRTAHVRGPVELGPLPEKKKTLGEFEKEPMRWVAVPAVSRQRRKVHLKHLEKAVQISEASSFNFLRGSGKTGIIASGVSVSYARDAINELNCWDQMTFFNLGMSYPQPRTTLLDFLKKMDKVIVIEELEPFQETYLMALSQQNNIPVTILGKSSAHFPITYELTPLLVKKVIADVLGMDLKGPDMPDISALPNLPARPPSLCKGCPHTESYNAVKEALIELGILENTIYPTDIGCYTLGLFPPIQMADYLLCMGSSIGTAMGFSKASRQKVVAFIGDSTFFHAGIPPLVNAVHNRHNFCLVILDNSTTAMTGHQQNPGIYQTPTWFDRKHTRVPIEDVVKGCGVKNLVKINPFHKKEAVETLKEILSKEGLSVVISEAPCILYAKKLAKK